MEEFGNLRERVGQTKINEGSSEDEDCTWNYDDPFSSSYDDSSPTKATEKNTQGEEGTRPGKSRATQRRESNAKSLVPRESSSPKPKERREKPHKCTACGRSFRKRRTLDSHVLSHLRTTTYECNQCRKSFDSKTALRLHSCSVGVDGPLEFTVARKGFTRKGNLVSTVVVTKRDRQHVCADCGHAFKDKALLRVHKRVHTGEKPYQCHVCDKSFATTQTLNAHLHTHTGEKPYKCSICEKSFARKHHLDRHVMVHTRLKPHHCALCGENFSRKSYLNVHMRAHNGDDTKRIRKARSALHDDLLW